MKNYPADALELAHWHQDWLNDAPTFATSVLARCGGNHDPVRARAVAEHLAAVVGAQLQQRHWHMATAESCTGGGIAQTCTAISGSSAWFEGCLVTYSNAAKTALLGVPGEMLAEHGAVSAPVVEAMARGAVLRLSAQCAVAVSGVAGPAGGSVAKPVGTVYLCWAGPLPAGPTGSTALLTQRLWFPGDRNAVRMGTVLVALVGLYGLAQRAIA